MAGLSDERGKRVVKFVLKGRRGWLFVDDPGDEGLIGFGESAKSSEDVRIGDRRLAGTEFGNVERDRGKELAVGLDHIRSDANVQERRIRGKCTRMLVFVAMCGKQIPAVGWAIESNLALGAATNGANFLRLGWAKPPRFELLTNWTRHE